MSTDNYLITFMFIPCNKNRQVGEIESDSEPRGVPVARGISAAAGDAKAKRTGGRARAKAVIATAPPSTNRKKKASNWKRKRKRGGSKRKENNDTLL